MTIELRALTRRKFPVPKSEHDRLEELYSLDILDTASEQRFDQYTELLAQVLDVPISLITLVDRDRQWIKSAYGVEIQETPREISFCTHALLEPEMLVVPDARNDARFSEYPFVRGELNIRFYAGGVLRGPSGKPLGTCCALDINPRELTDKERTVLRQITKMIEYEMHARVESESLKRNLQSYALMDASTDLPNLVSFSDKLHDAITGPKASSQELLLALVRIEQFEGLHAALGGSAMAFVIEELAERIRNAMPRSCYLGRTREDKLGIFLPLSRGDVPATVLDQLLNVIREPIDIGEHSVPLRVSIGASRFPRDAKNAETLLKRACTALWSRGISSESGYKLYRRRDSNQASQQFRIESALRQGLEDQEFRLVYQPKIDISGHRLVGAEALLRWTSKTLGEVSPVQFIPVAEETGLIRDLGRWVLDAAAKQLRTWSAPEEICPEIAVNVTSRQIREARFIDDIKRIIDVNQLKEGQLNLELTEGSLVEDIEGAIKIMHSLRKMGVTFAIDDFGTGFSSLSYLRRMPIQTLKIDRSFIKNVTDNAEDMKLVRSIISMGHDLGLKVVAEGVETERQLAFLQSVQCDQIQGFLFSAPLSSADFRQQRPSWDGSRQGAAGLG